MTLEEQLAAAQAENAKLREALTVLSESVGRFVSDEGWCQSDMDNMDAADCLLAQPTDTSALQQAIDAAYERAADLCERQTDALSCAAAIRALKGEVE